MFNAMRGDINAIREDITQIWDTEKGLEAEIAGLRTELRGEFKAGFTELNGKLDKVLKQLDRNNN